MFFFPDSGFQFLGKAYSLDPYGLFYLPNGPPNTYFYLPNIKIYFPWAIGPLFFSALKQWKVKLKEEEPLYLRKHRFD